MSFSHSQNINAPLQLSAAEMLAISETISREFAPSTQATTPELVLLAVDPFTLYAFWNLGTVVPTPETSSFGKSPLVLRVYSRPELNADTSQVKICFDLALKEAQTQIKVVLPIDAATYSAEIGKREPGRGFQILAVSNSVTVPRGGMAPLPNKPILPAASDASKTDIVTAAAAPADLMPAPEQENIAVTAVAAAISKSPVAVMAATPIDIDIPVTAAEQHSDRLRVMNLDTHCIQEYQPAARDLTALAYDTANGLDLLLNSMLKSPSKPLSANNNQSGQGIGH